MTPPRRVNGELVSRAELGAHLDRIDERIESLHTKVDEIADYVKTPPRWIAQRMTVLIDRGIIIAVTSVIAYIAINS